MAVVILSVRYRLARSTHVAHPSLATLIAAELQARGEVVKKALRDHRFGDFADAIEDLISIASPSARASEEMLKAYLLLATAQLAAGRDEAAEASFKEFLDRSSDQAAARNRIALARADALLMGGRFPEAAPLYEAAAAEHETPEAFAGLAMCRIRQGEAASAARDLDRAVELGFDPDRARPVRAQIRADPGRTDEALELAREATNGDDPKTEAAYTLVYVLVAAQHPGAEAAVREYVAAHPNDPDLPALLARPAPGGGTWHDLLDRASGGFEAAFQEAADVTTRLQSAPRLPVAPIGQQGYPLGVRFYGTLLAIGLVLVAVAIGVVWMLVATNRPPAVVVGAVGALLGAVGGSVVAGASLFHQSRPSPRPPVGGTRVWRPTFAVSAGAVTVAVGLGTAGVAAGTIGLTPSGILSAGIGPFLLWFVATFGSLSMWFVAWRIPMARLEANRWGIRCMTPLTTVHIPWSDLRSLEVRGATQRIVAVTEEGRERTLRVWDPRVPITFGVAWMLVAELEAVRQSAMTSCAEGID